MKIAMMNDEKTTYAEYFNYLCKIVCPPSLNGVYTDFMHDLDAIKFVSLVANDDNRSMDAIKLRETFQDETKIMLDYNDYHKVTSILEVFIALAQRMEFTLSQNDGTDRTGKWFWLFVKNLKLRVYRTNDSNIPRMQKTNNDILQRFLYREYDRNGNGGIFPLEHTKRDQRTVELWYQMQAYIDENDL
jgi:hypothetical protein